MTIDAGHRARPARREIVVVGASAGGVEALETLVGGLPAELPAAVFVVLHLAPTGYSALPNILTRAGELSATAPQPVEAIERGHVYVAPPDFHMLIDVGSVRLTRGPRQKGHRPAIDPLFRSAARAYGSRCIGAILSGTLDDGTAGLRFLKGQGGLAFVQDPADARYSGMPESAIAAVAVDCVAPAAELAAAICAALDGDARARDADGTVIDPISRPESPDLAELPSGENDVRSAGGATRIPSRQRGSASIGRAPAAPANRRDPSARAAR